ncbi:MAG: UDP-N-acetylglucosamine 1-carboxyvinyltransferase [Elusimicrobia bacterium]|nr:UDP-N-acetylglucosamine 1-carboxyvinyltransferase [Elusimicrobiota bacterium]MBP9127663.1 UDP-N-acetylglucosamine 1-carboxyvinyltransferase [Elusimicrobiota bacterium]MBP9698910.1 UDP-N-acetylglucosamine 1-carboxyvinyltransferase [Elusimicrobiota bacterium]
MDSFVVKGGKRLAGAVRVSGSKNAALPCLFATLLTDHEVVLDNVPDLQDIRTAVRLLERLGKRVTVRLGRVTVCKKGVLKERAPYDLVRRMRASAVVMGPLLARLGKADVSLPGGCAIGARPINFHLKAFESMGVKISVQEGYILAQGRLKGCRVKLPFASVGATENILMAASLAQGRTVLDNAAREPEITDLARLLTAMGARIHGAGTARIVIEGVKTLAGAHHRVIPDRIEAGTLLIAAAMTRGKVKLTDIDPSHLGAVIEALRRAGLNVSHSSNTLEAAWVRSLKPVSIKTRVYPGFPTDMQAQWMALMAVTPGRSVIQEDIFENRFLHAQELVRMGARIDVRGARAVIEGVPRLSGCPLMVSDLRAGAALVLAGLVARGQTRVLRVYHLDRGYERLEKKLRFLGANMRRVPQ